MKSLSAVFSSICQTYLYYKDIIFFMPIVATLHHSFPGYRPGTLCSCCSDQLVLLPFSLKLIYGNSFAQVSQPTNESWSLLMKSTLTIISNQQYHDVKLLFLLQHGTLPM